MFIIDRFEGQLVVLEYEGRTYHLPRQLLPAEAREGDVLQVSFHIDAPATSRRRERIRELEDNVFE